MNAAADTPIFRAFHNEECVAEVSLDSPVYQGIHSILSETQRLTFAVEPKEPRIQYRIQIGDIAPEHAIGNVFRRCVEWPNDLYLDSARGLVDIRLYSRTEEPADSEWRRRAILPVAVNSSKLTEAAFEAMVGDLTALSSGLLFDLLSKSRTGLKSVADFSETRASPRSAQLELLLLEELARELALVLLEISKQPQTVLRTKRVITSWTGCERLSSDSLAWFLARGLDPRKATVGNEMLGPRLQVVPEPNSIEHGIIRWFLELLQERAIECAKRANAERISLEADKPYRNRRFGGDPSLFELFDQPKIDRLTESGGRAVRIAQSIRGMSTLPFLIRQLPTAPVEQTPIFRNVLSYHRFWCLMREYLRHTTILLEHNLDERSKPTWRMYEQWVFLQIAAACEEIGLSPSSHDSLFRRLGTHLFTVDLRRGTRLGFTATDGRLVLLRYEPWIFSRDIARRNGEAVFQGRDGEAPWSPDVLIEVYEPVTHDQPAQLTVAIVVDAKYSRSLQEHHWDDTSKYQMIRDTEGGAQVVRQVWLALPAQLNESSDIIFRDQSVSWTIDGPNRPLSASEFLQGAVSMAPDPLLPKGTLCPSARELMFGLLTWLNFREAAGYQRVDANG